MHRVLLLEDDSNARLTFLKLLRIAGFETVVATNGLIAEKKLGEGRWDAILMDPMTPGVNGSKYIKRIRDQAGLEMIPVYVCTAARRMEAWRKRATKAGASKVFDKRLTPPDKIVAELAAHFKMGNNPTEQIEPDTSSSPAPALAPVAEEAANKVSTPKSSHLSLKSMNPFNFFRRKTPVKESAPVVRAAEDKKSGAESANEASATKPTAEAPSASATVFKNKSAVPESKSAAAESASAIADQTSSGAKSTSVTAGRTSTTDNQTSVTAKSASATKGSATVSAKLSSITDDQASVGDKQTSVTVKSAQVTEQSASPTSKSASSTADQTSKTKEQSSMTAKSSAVTGEKASVTAKSALVTTDQTAGTVDQASVTAEETSTTKQQTSVSAKSASVTGTPASASVKQSLAVSEEKAAPSPKRSAVSQEAAVASAKAAVESAKAAVESAKPPVVQTREQMIVSGQMPPKVSAASEQEEVDSLVSTPVSSLLLGMDGKILSTDDTLAAMFGWEDGELIGNELIKLFSSNEGDGLQEFLQNLDQANEGEAPGFFVTGQKQDDSEVPLFVSFFRNPNGTQDFWRAVVQVLPEAPESSELQKQLLAMRGNQVNLELQLSEAAKSRDDLLKLLRNTAFGGSLIESGDPLKNATEVTEKMEELLREECERSKKYQEEIVRLQEAREELNQKLLHAEQASEESVRRSETLEDQLAESKASLERLEEEFANKETEHSAQESKLRKQLDTAYAGNEKLLTLYREQSTQCMRSFDELVALRKTRDELADKLAEEHKNLMESKQRCEELEGKLKEGKAELERLKAEWESQINERGRPEESLCNRLEAIESEIKQHQSAYDGETIRRLKLEDDLEELQNKQKELNEELAQKEKSCQELRSQNEDLEKQLQTSETELKGVKEELAKHVQERSSIEFRLKEQLEAAKAELEKVKVNYNQETAFFVRSSEDVAALRKAREELTATLAAERQVAEQSARYTQELERQLKERSSELDRIKEELAKQIADHKQLESQCLDLAGANETLKSELSDLRNSRTIVPLASVQSLEPVQETLPRLVRLTSDLEQERGKRHRAEQRANTLGDQLKNLHQELKRHLEIESDYQQKNGDLEKRLAECEESLNKVTSDWEKEVTTRKFAEEQLEANKEISEQLKQRGNSLAEAKEMLDQFRRAQEELENQLKRSLDELQDSKSRLQKEIGDRQTAQSELETTQRAFQELSRKTSIELAGLKSALQSETLERQRLETQMLESRYERLDVARASRASLNGFRQQLQSPLQNLLQATRRLLEIELAGEDKKLAEEALRNAFELQENLDEQPNPTAENPTAGQIPNDSSSSSAQAA